MRALCITRTSDMGHEGLHSRLLLETFQGPALAKSLVVVSRDPMDRSVFPKRHGAWIGVLLPLAMLCGCTQALGLDDPGTLQDDAGGAGGHGGARPATTLTSTVGGSTAAVTSGNASGPGSSGPGGPGCGTCPPTPNACVNANCMGSHCLLTPVMQGSPCATGVCDGAMNCVPANCQSQPQCGAADYCDLMTCHPKKAQDAPCLQAYECMSNDCQNLKCKS
jgi:hypothetical protein